MKMMSSQDETPEIAQQMLAELESGGLVAFLNTLRAATSIIGTTDLLLRNTGTGLNTREWDALAFIAGYGPIRPTDLLRLLALTHSAQTVSSLVDRLEERGLVDRRPDPSDKRAVLVAATDDGLRAVGAIYPVIRKRVIEPFLSEYSEEEIEKLAHLLGLQIVGGIE